MLYQDADCTIEYDLTDVTKSTNIAPRSGYPLSYAFDGSLSTYFRNNYVFSAYEGSITFEFAHEVQVMCVKTTTTVGNYAHLPYGFGYASAGAGKQWSNGIVLEASCDGINFVAAAGPDPGSNNVVADKAYEDDPSCTDERGLQLKPGGAFNFEIFCPMSRSRPKPIWLLYNSCNVKWVVFRIWSVTRPRFNQCL